MTCSDVRRVLPEMLDGAPDSAFHNDFDDHVRSCPECSGLMSDLDLIASEAPRLAANEEPGPHVWAQIAAQLRAEGVIRESSAGVSDFEAVSARPRLVRRSRPTRWSAWWLVPIAAALIVAGSYVVNHKAAPQLARVQVPAPSAATGASDTSATLPSSTTASSATPTTSVPAPASQLKAQAPSDNEVASAVQPSTEKPLLESANSDDQQFLSEVSTLAPSMRATYESQLRAVNADIRESQAYLDQNPGDADARQHLMDAYQQKALLYQIALDRIQ
jgi:predicted anti-sigma-YlaC factor YlaD